MAHIQRAENITSEWTKKGGNSDEENMNDDGIVTAELSVLDEDPKYHLHRGLKARQVAMIAIGGSVGTGLIIGT
jgi:amino acid transporter